MGLTFNPLPHLFLIALLLISTALCGVDDAETIFQRLTDTYDRFSSYQASFTQVNRWTEQDIEMTSNGSIYLKGDDLSLSYTHPEGQKLMVKDGVIYLINEAEKTVLITEADGNRSFSPIDIVRDYWSNSEKELKQIGGNYEITLKPHQKDEVTEIQVQINRTNSLLKKISYTDAQGNLVSFVFTGEKLNQSLPASVFELPADSGYTVIDQRTN